MSRHWNPKTGRGRFNNNAPRAQVSVATAKKIVRKAGPQDRRLFTETDRTNALYAPKTWIGGAAGTGLGALNLFAPVDYEESTLSHRERVRISSIEMRGIFEANTASSPGHVSHTHIMWFIFKASTTTADRILTGIQSPWASDFSEDFANQDAFIMKRGRFSLLHTDNAALATTGPGTTLASNALAMGRFRKDLYIKFRKKHWIREEQNILFYYQWWRVIRQGVLGGAGPVIGSHDCLVRWQRY